MARSIVVALNSDVEQLPAKSTLPEVPVHESGRLQYVRIGGRPVGLKSAAFRAARPHSICLIGC